jgi:hypothetical protein
MTPATTLVGVPPSTAPVVIPSTTLPNTAIVTGVVVPCTGQPPPLPEAIFNSVDLDTPGEQVVAPAPVLSNGSYRFSNVAPGHYELAEGPSASPEVIRHIWVRNSQTVLVDLPGCVPSVGGTYQRASASALRHFLAEAQSNNQAFAATYRTLNGVSGPRTFSYAQQPQGRGTWSPHGIGDFVYAASRGQESFKFVQRDRGDYACVQKRRHGPWTCDGPHYVVSSIGDYLQTAQFDEQESISTHMVGHLSPIQAWIWSGPLGGMAATCLRYIDPDALGSRSTWCITGNGITVFVVAPSVANVEVAKLSTSVPVSDFSLPARPRLPWQGACLTDIPPDC